MAVIRCMDHSPDEDFRDWVVAVEPVGYPETAVICPHRSHDEVTPGLLFLTEFEYELHQRGSRVFSPSGNATRIQVTDTVHTFDAIRLPRPPEPSLGDLAAELDMTVEELGQETIPHQFVQRVQSDLWSNYWSDRLKPCMSWNEFRSRTANVNTVLKEWAAANQSWDDVLTRYAEALDADIHS